MGLKSLFALDEKQGINLAALETIVESLPSGVIVVEKTSEKIVYVNKRFVEITGFNPNGVSLKEYAFKMAKVRRLNRSPFLYEQLPLSKALYGKTTRSKEIIIHRPDRSELTVSVNAKSLTNESGKIIGAIAVFEDTTERKKAEEAVRLSEEKFSIAFNNSPIAITITRLSDGKIIEGNEFSFKLFGWNQGEVLGKTTLELGIWANPEDRFKLAKKLSSKGIVENMELVLRKKNGTKFPVNLSAALITVSGQQCFLSSFTDISKRKKAQKALKRSERVSRSRADQLEKVQVELEEKAGEVEEYATSMEQLAKERLLKLKDAERLAAIGATAGMVGHDIRNPLQSILSELYLARSELPRIERADAKNNLTESIASIEREVEYINKIVQDLQDFARPVTPVAREFSLRELCNDVLKKTHASENVRKFCVVEEEAKQANTDPEVLRRVLSNLVMNAVQAMPDGGIVTVRARKEKEATVVIVEDTGEGIPEGVRAKLFTPLFTTKSKGQGFGLAAAKRLVEALGGSVSFESEVGKGTIFFVRLPIMGSG